MKRFNKTAIALATAGALAFAAAPAADAQPTPRPTHATAPASPNDADASIFGTPGASETHVPGNSAPDLGTPTIDQGGKVSGGGEEVKNRTPGTPVTLKKGDRVVNSKNETQLTATEDGEFAVLMEGDHIFDANNVDVTQFRGGTVAEGDSLVKPGEVKDDEIQAILAAAALAAVPLVIGGIIYKVVKDNQGKPVLVPADRPDQTPTPEDKDNTDKLVKENADEIARQGAEQGVKVNEGEAGDAAARGVNADTGNNGIAKGLLGLVIASIMGAAVFMFGRRQLV